MKAWTWTLLIAGGYSALACGGDGESSDPVGSGGSESGGSSSSANTGGGSGGGTGGSGAGGRNASGGGTFADGGSAPDGGSDAAVDTAAGDSGTAGDSAASDASATTDAGGGAGDSGAPSVVVAACQEVFDAWSAIDPTCGGPPPEVCVGLYLRSYQGCETEFSTWHHCLASAVDLVLTSGSSCRVNLLPDECNDARDAVQECARSAGP
jgi:hypothetical protein